MTYREPSKKTEMVAFYEGREGWFTVQDVVDNVDVSYEAARLFLNELVEEGVLVRDDSSQPHEFRHGVEVIADRIAVTHAREDVSFAEAINQECPSDLSDEEFAEVLWQAQLASQSDAPLVVDWNELEHYDEDSVTAGGDDEF